MNQEIAFGIFKTGRNIFLTGSAGTGKTYLLNQYIQYLQERDIQPTITAPTGIAASHIGGMTIHSFFGIGIKEWIDDYFLDCLLQKEYLYRRLRAMKVLIIDEISMVSPELFVSVDKILRAFKNSDKPFGGIQIILSGDFFQLPPVSKTAKNIKFAWQTGEWQAANLKVCYLEEKFRQSDESLISILDEIRAGSVSENSMDVFRSCYKKELPNSFKAAKLYTHNEDVDRINKEELEALSGEPKIFKSLNKGSRKNIERILNSSLVIEELKLKKGALVIFIKNNYEAGYINGTLGKVISFSKTTGAPIVEIFSGEKIAAEPEDWKYENEKGELKAVIRQIPLRLAWALTVHKSQGMTLDAAEIDLSKTFEAGQGYVALSRIRSIKGLRLMGLNEVALQVDESVLKIDREMRDCSRLYALKFRSFSDEEKEKMNREFIVKSGGVILKRLKKSS
ncbi:MAG: PIF1 family DEAD/DEAH box helicase [bacterium]|nr:PIF1 family DEAD/DEAH box helicase [bacterium]